jgi:hypothetical protein
MIYVFTSATANYLPKVRMLTHSVRKFLPESRIILAMADVIDVDMDLSVYGIDEVIPISETLCEVPNYQGWIFQHTVIELSTAVKPFVLLKLLEREDCEAVLYLDPDIVIFSEIGEIFQSFADYSILLIPHLTDPETEIEKIIDNDLCVLRNGAYNLGFIGVKKSPEGLRYAKWWQNRVALFCYDDIPLGLFTDQKWNDLTPGLFDEVKLLKSRRYDVATWNTSQRHLSGDFENGFRVNGEPLGFYHFTGFDNGDHKVMAKKNSSAVSCQMKLVKWYAREIKEINKDPLCQRSWRWNYFNSGAGITKEMRSYYRKNEFLWNRYPNPFDDSGADNYLLWFKKNIGLVDLNADIHSLRAELNGIYQSRAWQLYMLLRRIKRRVGSRLSLRAKKMIRKILGLIGIRV